MASQKVSEGMFNSTDPMHIVMSHNILKDVVVGSSLSGDQLGMVFLFSFMGKTVQGYQGNKVSQDLASQV